MIDGGLIDDGVRDSVFPLIDGENIDDLKVVDLKKALGLRGLKKSGLKGELKERLRQDLISHSVESHSDASISSEEHKGTSTILPNLPSFKPINHSSGFKVYSTEGKLFCDFLDSAYDEAVKWRKNVFKIPSGKAGKEFIKLQSQWLSKFNNEDSFMGISLKVVMTLPMILLQKPSASSKAKDHSQALSRRIKWLKDGELQRLLSECRSIQRQLRPKTMLLFVFLAKNLIVVSYHYPRKSFEICRRSIQPLQIYNQVAYSMVPLLTFAIYL